MLRTYLNGRRKWGRELTLAAVPDRGVDDADAALTVTLSALLTQLPATQRAALVLRFYQDLTVPQIAEELGVPEGTVKSQLSRGLATMRTRLDDRSDVAPGPPAAREPGETEVTS
jgi:RNA polymerase sigma factor (sigma-70 family)